MIVHHRVIKLLYDVGYLCLVNLPCGSNITRFPRYHFDYHFFFFSCHIYEFTTHVRPINIFQLIIICPFWNFYILFKVLGEQNLQVPIYIYSAYSLIIFNNIIKLWFARIYENDSIHQYSIHFKMCSSFIHFRCNYQTIIINVVILLRDILYVGDNLCGQYFNKW